MNGFEVPHSSFIRQHLNRRSGERRGRLERGHGHAEILFARNVWWPYRGNLEHLHPEFEVLDWRGRSYFADFAFSPERWKLLIEIKGFSEHVTNMDRQKYCNELNRETFLVIGKKTNLNAGFPVNRTIKREFALSSYRKSS